MAWRPTENVIEGELDNTEAGRITGWLHFASYPHRVVLNLAGDMTGSLSGRRAAGASASSARTGTPGRRNTCAASTRARPARSTPSSC